MNEKTINIEQFRKVMATKEEICDGSEMFIIFHKLAQEALQITSEINNKYNTPEQIVELFSKLTGTQVDKSFRCFPPFYTDCGKNIKIGKNVFINACCQLQPQELLPAFLSWTILMTASTTKAMTNAMIRMLPQLFESHSSI